MFSNSRLYFTKQPFDPEFAYKKSSSSDEFFATFYGAPKDLVRPFTEMQGCRDHRVKASPGFTYI